MKSGSAGLREQLSQILIASKSARIMRQIEQPSSGFLGTDRKVNSEDPDEIRLRDHENRRFAQRASQPRACIRRRRNEFLAVLVEGEVRLDQRKRP